MFRAPAAILQTADPAEIPALLEQIEAATVHGAWAAGYLAYEAAPAFDPALGARAFSPATGSADVSSAPPLLWFALYDRVDLEDELDSLNFMPQGGTCHITPWKPSLDLAAFTSCVQRIRELIAAGDTYQVNFTFPLHADFEGDPFALFLDLHRAQRAGHSAFIAAADRTIISASPELFFAQSGDTVVTRPMKGTAPRGRWPAEDDARAAALAASEKERAENVMIVDLLRNDLGRVARTGSVRADPLFTVERYPSVLQMTSTVRAQTDAHPVRTLAALFPCGSVTGAPKVRTMEIIAELETAPRGIYTGAIGWFGPGRRACFSVAIRTVELLSSLQPPAFMATYGVGSGITWPSDAAAEYEECLLKARLLAPPPPPFDLLETLRWDPDSGYFLLEEHLARLAASAAYFSRPCDLTTIRAALADAAADFSARAAHPRRVRLTVNAHGAPRLEISNLQSAIHNPQSAIPLRVALAAAPMDSRDPFLFHKTTHRAVYDRARSRPLLPRVARPGDDDLTRYDDVILFNERGELTESTIANIVIDRGDGVRLTPALDCGLLPGTFRAHLLSQGAIREAVLPVAVLQSPHRLWLINSVRRWMEAKVE